MPGSVIASGRIWKSVSIASSARPAEQRKAPVSEVAPARAPRGRRGPRGRRWRARASGSARRSERGRSGSARRAGSRRGPGCCRRRAIGAPQGGQCEPGNTIDSLAREPVRRRRSGSCRRRGRGGPPPRGRARRGPRAAASARASAPAPARPRARGRAATSSASDRDGRAGVERDRPVAKHDAMGARRQRHRAEVTVRPQDRQPAAVLLGDPARIVEVRQDEQARKARRQLRDDAFGRVLDEAREQQRVLLARRPDRARGAGRGGPRASGPPRPPRRAPTRGRASGSTR